MSPIAFPASQPDKRDSAAKRGYGRRWQRYRRAYLSEHPLCVRCEAEGKVVSATVVDHITPHKGDHELFWNADNHQALCKPCHDTKTLFEEQGREQSVGGCDANGMPIDPRHPWNL